MRKVTIVILVLLIAAFAGTFVYLDQRQESQTGYQEGRTMGYLYGFNDGKAGNPLETETLKERLFVEGASAYDKAFLIGAREGYVQGYAAGKQSQ